MLKFLFAISLAGAIHADPIFRLVTAYFDGVITQSINAPAFQVGQPWHGYIRWSIPDALFKTRSFMGGATEANDCWTPQDPDSQLCFGGSSPGIRGQAEFAQYRMSVTDGVLDGAQVQASVNRFDGSSEAWLLEFSGGPLGGGFEFSLWFGANSSSEPPDVFYAGQANSARLAFEPEPGTFALAAAGAVLVAWRARRRAI